MAEQIDVLIVDDDKVNLVLLEGILKSLDVNVVRAQSGREAIDHVGRHDFAVILLDIMMPGLDGFETAEILRSQDHSQHIPIIFVTAISKEQHHVFKGYELGAVDYMFKPVNPDILKSKVNVFVDLHRNKRKLEEKTYELERTIERLKKSEESLTHQAMHDALTDLPNRLLCQDRIRHAMERVSRRDNYHYAVAFMDIDRFKVVNDSLGHSFGDTVLREVGAKAIQCVRSLDTVSRFSGDEFVILMEELTSPREAIQIMKRLRESFREPMEVSGHVIQLTMSLGIVLSPATYERPEDILQHANIALHQAKVEGGDRIRVFNERMLQQAIQQMTIESELRRAIAQDEFIVHYQPLVSLKDSKAVGFEALTRWLHPKRGLVSPGMFIPLAEETGLIIPIGQEVLAKASMMMAEMQASLPDSQDLYLSVNLSAKQFSQTDLVDQIQRSLAASGLPPERLNLEITETAVMENAEVAVEKLRRLKSLGIKLSIDDFGTGYSSMSYLQQFPIDQLKIDLSFIRRMDEAPENVEIVRAIINLAHSLNLKVVAEGVENETQQHILMGLGCEYGQGYLFSKPTPPEEAVEYVRNGGA